MAGINKPPIRLAILDYYAGQTGDLFKAETVALYTHELSLSQRLVFPNFCIFFPFFVEIVRAPPIVTR